MKWYIPINNDIYDPLGIFCIDYEVYLDLTSFDVYQGIFIEYFKEISFLEEKT